MKKKLQEKDVKIENVKYSRFGCMNCLWYSVECIDHKKFEPKVSMNQPSCKSYNYYD